MDKQNLTQFGRGMKQLGIEIIPGDSPEARGRSERVFKTHQDRLVNELALKKITSMEEVNRYMKIRTYQPTMQSCPILQHSKGAPLFL